MTNVNAKKYVESLPVKPVVSVTSFIKYDNKDCLDLLDKMLIINPLRRITAEEAL
jgi:serine/threonine protein kinase